MAHLFYLSDTNPNDTTGGGGCLCSPIRESDTRGPYIVIPSNDMESIASPHVVVCAECLKELNRVAAGEQLGAGEHETLPTPRRSRKPDPEAI